MSRERARTITRAIQEKDRELFALSRYGRIDIMRRGFKYEAYDLGEEGTLLALVRNDYHVMSLTDTWNALGKPVEWGVLPIMARLNAIDLHRRDLAEEAIRHAEREAESADRDLDNHLEAFWKDNRRAWSKNFDQVNRSSLDKRRDRRYDDEKKQKLKGI